MGNDATSGHVLVVANSGHVPVGGNKFEDTTLYSTFSWTSQCPRTAAAGIAHVRVHLKSLAKQAQVDPKTAVFSDVGVTVSWRRPVTERAAHA